MPSSALGKFEGVMMRDVDRIIQTHSSIQNGTPGNMGLGHLTGAGVLLLCAAWELYIEEVIIESVKHSIDRCVSPDDLPNIVKKTISDYVRNSKHQLKPLTMAGDGWKVIYLEIAREWVTGLNTPKSNNINEGFHKILGIQNLSSSWTLGVKAINDFVTARGDVAHQGSDAGNIRMNVLSGTYKIQVCKCAIETDNALTTFLRSAFSPNTYTWNRRGV